MLHIPSAVTYGSMSILMVLANKYLLSSWNFDCVIFLILLEMLLNIFVISIIKLKSGKSLFTFKYDERMKNLAIGAFFYSIHSVMSLKALDGMSIPIYTVFKRCVPLVNLILSCFLIENKNENFSSNEKKIHNRKIIFSIIAMTFGVLIAGAGELSFDMLAYIYCGISVICQGLYLTYIQKCGENSQKDAVETLFECSLITLPFLFSFFFFSNEFKDLQTSPNFKLTNFNFLLTFFLVLASGCLLSFSQVWCTINNNAITTSVVGILKSILQSLFGIILFNAWKTLTFLSYAGLLCNFLFGSWYTYLKYKEKDVNMRIPHSFSDFQINNK